MTDIKKLGEMALVLPLEVAYREGTVDITDYFYFADFEEFRYNIGNDIVFRMHELNDFYSNVSNFHTTDLIAMIERSDWFTVHDGYYVKEDGGKLRSMGLDEAKQYYVEQTDIVEFLHWMRENDYEEEVECYLTDLAGNLEEKSGIERIIIEL